jgi:hypothetical protein
LQAEDAKVSLFFFFFFEKHCQGSSAGSMEPSRPVKASLLVDMADYRIELVIKQVKKGHAYTESRPTHHR